VCARATVRRLGVAEAQERYERLLGVARLLRRHAAEPRCV
jgi:hypothetical protein